MTDMPECPICGKKITIHLIDHGFDSVCITGCEQCGLVTQSLVSAGAAYALNTGLNNSEDFKKWLVSNWEEARRRSPNVNSMKAENVLRTAYGMPQVTYLDFIERDVFRRIKNDNKI